MDETLKHFKLSGGDMGDKQVIVACKPEQEDAMRKKFEGYTLEECECPKDAQLVSAEPRIDNPRMFKVDIPHFYDDPWANVKSAVYDGPNCAKCLNRFRRNAWCDTHYLNTGKCYRVKYRK